jgi:hypothetical protein
MNGGICSSCQEELYILTYQADDIDQPVSDEFAAKANQQRAELVRKRVYET